MNDLAARACVDQPVAHRHLVRQHASPELVQLQNVAILEDERVLQIVAPDLHRQRLVLRQLPVFAVNRHEVARADQIEDQLQLLAAGVAGNMQARAHIAIEHLRAASVQVIDHLEDRTLVPGNHLGAKGHDVAVFNVDQVVLADSGASQRRTRLAL